MAGKPPTPKIARTIRSRRLHYFAFCHDLKLTDDWTLANQSQDRANLQLALYATHLATGSSIYCRSIKSSTINSYLADISKFLGRFREIDPRFISSADTKLAPVIAKVLAEQKRWESVPNRREPFTLPMYNIIAATAKQQSDITTLEVAMANWTLCNLYAGCRGIEWAQTSTTQAPISMYLRNRFNNAYAFTLSDVKCSTTCNQRLTMYQVLQNPSKVGKIHLRFEEQKNGDNGEWKLFVRNTNNTNLCFINAFLQILQRYHLLTDGNLKNPLSIYRAPTGTVYNITTADVERTLRATAASLFHLDPQKHKSDLQLWSAHSLRVGACTTLYANGFNDTEIKFLLRWKSNAFMTYLRNLTVTSRRQNNAMNDTNTMPNFL
jgi:hypothetical protein